MLKFLSDGLNVIIIMVISMLLFAAALFYLLILNHLRRKHQKTFEHRVMVSAFFTLLAIWCMRLLYVNFNNQISGMTFFEKIVDSGLHAMKSLSMDEEYTEVLLQGKQMIAKIFPDSDFMLNFYSFYTTLLNIAAPFVGGAIIFVIAAKIFPRLKLRFATLLLWKPICYFSELNERSLALAQSLREKGCPLRRSIIVFTNICYDNEDEAVTELIHRAKCIGAICIQDGIADIPMLLKHRTKKFFLIDENELNNLDMLSSFLDKKICSKFNSSKSDAKKDEIYYFYQDDSNILVDKKFREALKAKIGKENMPGIVPVRRYRNRILNLLENEPLFKGLDPKKGEPLNVTVFGTGPIGTEMFLSTYWCGQLLDHELFINMVSNESEADFRARIDHINPEIFKTSNKNSSLLNIYPGSDKKAPVYFNFRYYQTDVKHDDLYGKLTKAGKDGFRLINSTYFLVALGSDKDNLEIANLLSRYINIDSLERPIKLKIPIAYVIYDDKLMKTLKAGSSENKPKADAQTSDSEKELNADVPNNNKITETAKADSSESKSEADAQTSDSEKEPNADVPNNNKITETAKADSSDGNSRVEMYPFGSINETYNYMKIVLSGISEQAEKTSNAYERTINIKITERKKLDNDQYTYWANISKVIFIKYKAFCIGLEVEEYLKRVQNKDEKEIRRNHRLAWLEHRRWNAFMRTQGFRAPTAAEEKAYIALLENDSNKTGINRRNHKNIELKLHPCIVECDDKGMKPDLFSAEHNKQTNDFLDEASVRIATKDAYESKYLVPVASDNDYKKYDYPEYDVE